MDAVKTSITGRELKVDQTF